MKSLLLLAVLLTSSLSHATYKDRYSCSGSDCNVSTRMQSQLLEDAQEVVRSGDVSEELMIAFAAAQIENEEISFEDYVQKLVNSEE